MFNQLRALIYDGPLAETVKLALTGSARVVQVRHAGSPLLNAVKIVHLAPFSEADLGQLVARGGEAPAGVEGAIRAQSGGHPFIAQYLLHHLWDESLAGTTPAQVEQIARKLRRQRAADLQGWWEAVGEGGRRAYALLAQADGWLDERDLLAGMQDAAQPLDQGLAALCYHGLAARDEGGRRYRAVGALFREWFAANAAGQPKGGVPPAPREETQEPIVPQPSDVSPRQPQETRHPQRIAWLHISDLHFQAPQAYDADVVLGALLRDVAERIQQDGPRPDFIVVTGDVAFAGQPAEYALARRFFDDLLRTTGLPRQRLFVVPGNHDANRNLVTAGAKAIGDALTDRDKVNALLSTPGDRRLLLARFEGYAEFVNSYLEHLAFDYEHYFYVRKLNLAGQQVALLGLNSAWLCASDEDKARGLLIGERQVRTALKQAQGASLKIALLHHPFDWLREFDHGDSAAMLLDNCDFVLHGHLHQMAATQLLSPDGAAMVLACGACYETRQFPNMVNWVQLDLATGAGVVYLRRYSDAQGGFWATDTLTYRNAPDGVYAFTQRLSSCASQSASPAAWG